MRIYQFSMAFYGKAVNGGARSEEDITTVVIHDTEGSTAEGAARTLTTRQDASAHLALDDDRSYRLLSDHVVAWTQMWNQHALSIEQAGFASWSERTWLKRIATIRRAAYWTAWWCYRYHLPVTWRSVADLNAGRTRGITSHNNVSLSKLSVSTHTDPGPNYPLKTFMGLVQLYRGRFATRTIHRPKTLG